MADQQLKIDVVLKDFTTKPLQGIQGALSGFSNKVSSAFGALKNAVFSVQGALAGLGLALTTKALADMVKGVADSADHLRDLGIRLGATTEFLSETEHAAKLTGLSLDDLASGLQFLQKTIGEFKATGRGNFAEILGLFNQEAQAAILNADNVEDQFRALAGAVKELGDSERVFVTSKLFGRQGGAKFLQLFSEDLDTARQAAKAFGLTVTGAAAAGADKFNDALVDLKAAFEGLKRTIILPLLPELAKGFKFLTETVQENKAAILDFFAATVESAGAAGKSITGVVNSIQDAFGPISGFASRIKASLLEARSVLRSTVGFGMGPNQEAAQKDHDAAMTAFLDSFEADAESRRKTIDGIGDTLESNAKKAANAIRALADAQREAREALQFVGPRLEDDPLMNVGVPTPEQVDAANRKLKENTQILKEQADVQADKARREDEQARRRESALLREQGLLGGIKAALIDLQYESKRWGEVGYASIITIQQSLSHGLTDALFDAAEGTIRWSDVWREASKSIIRSIGRVITEMLIAKVVQASLGGLGGLFTTSGGTGGGTVTTDNGAVVELGAYKGGVAPGHLEPVRGAFATGGVAREEGVYRLRERGQNEGIVPLQDNKFIPVKLSGSGSGATINQTFNFSYSFNTPADMKRLLEAHGKTIAGIVVKEQNRSLGVREGLAA